MDNIYPVTTKVISIKKTKQENIIPNITEWRHTCMRAGRVRIQMFKNRMQARREYHNGYIASIPVVMILVVVVVVIRALVGAEAVIGTLVEMLTVGM